MQEEEGLHRDQRVRLVLADDSARARRALRALLDTSRDMVIVGEASDGQQVIDVVARVQPDVLVMDLRMPVLDGVQATAYIKQRWPEVRVLIFSMTNEAWKDARAAGADALLMKGQPEDLLLRTIRDLGRKT